MTCRSTHHAGCECHEERHAEELAALRDRAEKAEADCLVLAAEVSSRRGMTGCVSLFAAIDHTDASGALKRWATLPSVDRKI